MPTTHHDAHPYGRSADDVRRRDRRLRRTRRLRATQLAIFSLLAVALIAVGVYAVGELRQPAADPGQIAPKTFGAAPVEMTCPEPDSLPLAPEAVTVTVLNGTTRSGLAGQVTEQLAERGYETGDPGNTRQDSGAVTIVHGPDGYLAAQSLAAQFEDAQLRFEEDVEGSAVQLLIGEGFTGPRDAEAAAATLEEPVALPEGC